MIEIGLENINVQRCPLDRSQHHGLLRHDTCESKITQLHDSVRTYQNVLRFHVSMYDTIGVQIVQGLNKILRNLPHHILRKTLIILQRLEQLTLRQLRHHTNVVIRLEIVQK